MNQVYHTFCPSGRKFTAFLCGLGFFWYEQKAESILLTLLYKVNALHTLARNLMQLIAPGAPETGAGAAQTAAPAQTGGAPNAVEEPKQYKPLLDAGVITEEEFAAKKRQLLGI